MSSKSQKLILEIHDKMQIARNIAINVAQNCPPEIRSNQKLLVKFYTEVDLNTIETVIKNKKRTKSFAEWYTLQSKLIAKPKICFEDLRCIIFDLYVNDLTVPTKKKILVKIKNSINNKYPTGQLDTDLYKVGYIWKRLPKSNKYIIVENTEQVARRMKYFNKIKQYREQKRSIIYTEFVLDHVVILSPERGLIEIYFNSEIQSIEFWILNKLNTVPDNAVFVIEQKFAAMDSICKIPTIHNKKKHMKEWLDLYDIPYDPIDHKSNLFTLIEKYKINCPPLNKTCEMLKARGYDCLLRPHELTKTKFSSFITRDVEMTAIELNLSKFKMYITDYINKIKPEDWLDHERILAEQESRMYEEDKKLELILDSVMEGVKNEDLSPYDFHECEDDVLDSEFYNTILWNSVQPFKLY